MKRNKIYAWMAAAMTLAACSTNDIADITANDADNVVNIASVTRAGETGNTTAQQMTAPFHLVNVTQKTKFDMKYEADYTFDNNTYSVNGLVVWCNSYDNEFQAFSPLKTPQNKASYTSFTPPTDQSTADKLAAADWMTATTTAKKGDNNGAISLNFEHQLSNIVITISDDAKSDLASLSDIKVLGTITPYYNSTAKTIHAIVETATTVPNASLLTFKDAAGESYTIPFPSTITSLDKGKQYNFTLTGGHNALTISSVSVTDWTATTVTPGKEDEASCADEDIDYITFTADSEQGFTFVGYDITIQGFEYSVGDGAWTSIPDAGLTGYVSFGGTLGTLRLRGKNQYGTSGFRTVKFSNNTPVACSGDIRTLIDYTQYKTVDTSYATFGSLFEGCTQLTTAPMLPSTQLAQACYANMFRDCTSLKEAPALLATQLADYCYASMFNGCIALTNAPALPAEQLATSCYQNMFNGCTALINAPALPATSLKTQCYYEMFAGCTALRNAPALPATSLETQCYAGMFSGCTALTNAPALPATELETQCYDGMFSGCTALTNAPALPATQLDTYCYDGMFLGCTALTNAPALPATQLAVHCYESMFNGCTALTNAPALPATQLENSCYYAMFYGCTNLSSVTMLAENVSATNCLHLWLNNAGTSAQSRTLKLKNATVYNTIINTTYYNYPALPDIWKSGASGTTIIFEEQ